MVHGTASVSRCAGARAADQGRHESIELGAEVVTVFSGSGIAQPVISVRRWPSRLVESARLIGTRTPPSSSERPAANTTAALPPLGPPSVTLGPRPASKPLGKRM